MEICCINQFDLHKQLHIQARKEGQCGRQNSEIWLDRLCGDYNYWVFGFYVV